MSRPRKNNADYFPHDNEERNDRRMLALRNKFGPEAYAFHNMFKEVLAKQDGFKIKLDDVEFELLAGDFGTDCSNLRQIFAEMVKLRLIKQNEDWYWSEDLEQSLSTVVDKRNRERERATERPREERANFIKSLGQDKPKEVVSAAETPQSKVKESKLKENIQRKDFKYFEDKEFTELYDSFLEMRKQKKKPATVHAEKMILNDLHKNSLVDAKKMLEISIRNSWTDVFPLPDPTKNPPRNRGDSGQVKLHDGGYAVWKFGKWVDERSGANIDLAYYPELTKN